MSMRDKDGIDVGLRPFVAADRVRGVEDPLDHMVPSATGRLSIPTSDGTLFLPYGKIIRLQADGSYTLVHSDGGVRILTCKGLGELHRRLPAALFHRCHHTHVINLHKVVKLLRTGGHRVQLTTGETVEVSRRKWQVLIAAMDRT